MCGRTACTLDPGAVCASCTYPDGKTGDKLTPQWRGDTTRYVPNYNMAPSLYGPVLVQSPDGERHLQAMRWGLVPAWYKGRVKELQLNINNCRADTMRTKPSFSGPLNKGRRCVVVVDGFYEWRRPSGGSKEPYFITFPEEGPGATGKRLLTMAGIYEVNSHCTVSDDSDPSSEPLSTYTVITVDSAGTPLAPIHDRIPAILDGEDAIKAWLDVTNYSLEKACDYIVPCKNITMHRVSNIVNNSRNNSPDCVKLYTQETSPPKKPAKTMLSNWLIKLSEKKSSDASDVKQEIIKEEDDVVDDNPPDKKKLKLEDV